jgi:hypothetical protein
MWGIGYLLKSVPQRRMIKKQVFLSFMVIAKPLLPDLKSK